MFPSLTLRTTTQHLALFLIPNGPQLPPSTAASIFLQFHADPAQEWRHLGFLSGEKQSAIFKLSLPPAIVASTELLTVSIGISLQPATASNESSLSLVRPQATQSTSQYALTVAKKLLDNFVNYALSFSRTFVEVPGGESFVPAKIISEWYAGTVRKAQADPDGFLRHLMRTSEATE